MHRIIRVYTTLSKAKAPYGATTNWCPKVKRLMTVIESCKADVTWDGKLWIFHWTECNTLRAIRLLALLFMKAGHA